MDWPGFIGLRWELGMALVVSAVGWGGGGGRTPCKAGGGGAEYLPGVQILQGLFGFS